MSKVIKESEGQTHFIEVRFKCPMCGKTHSIMLFEEDILKYKKERAEGKSIQDIFPYMPANDREKFLTGYCDDCQKLLFGGVSDD